MHGIVFFHIAVDPRSPKQVQIKTRGHEVAAESVAPARKRKARKRLAHMPKKVKRKATQKNPKSIDVTEKIGKISKADQPSTSGDEDLLEFSDSVPSSSVKPNKAVKYFPFRILDQSWRHIAADTPQLGLSHHSLHENTLPALCSRGLSDVKVVPRADRQGFVKTDGYWKLMIAGLNRRAVINAIFIPQCPARTEDVEGEEPRNGVFLSALATGAFPNWYPVETLLDHASEELTERRKVFVLDVYSHGQDKVEIIINRAY